MMFWRAFDHVSFAMLCVGIVFLLSLRASFEELLGLAATGIFWTIWHSYDASKKPDYQIGSTAKKFAAAFYMLAMVGILYLVFAPTGWKL